MAKVKSESLKNDFLIYKCIRLHITIAIETIHKQ